MTTLPSLGHRQLSLMLEMPETVTEVQSDERRMGVVKVEEGKIRIDNFLKYEIEDLKCVDHGN